MNKKNKIILLTLIFCLFFTNYSLANIKEKLLKKYNEINTLSFDFTQTIGDKIENGSCYIKYPLNMKCDYPKKKKSIIANGKKFAIVKKRYKKIYFYPLKKTPLFYLLKKENILNLVKNYEPINIDSNTIKYELIDENSIQLNIFFDKKNLNLKGWETTDSYANKVKFLIKNIETNILIKETIFKIPRQEDL